MHRIFLGLPVLREVVEIGVNLHYSDAEKTCYGNESEKKARKEVGMITYTHTDAAIAPRRAAPIVFPKVTFILTRF